MVLLTLFRICPNDECNQPTLFATLWSSESVHVAGYGMRELPVGDDPIEHWRLLPV
jgi:hypothetical protein